VDSSAPTAPVDSELVNENSGAADSEIINEIISSGEAWIHQRPQPLLTQNYSTKLEALPTQTSSTKLLAQVTRGFLTKHSPC